MQQVFKFELTEQQYNDIIKVLASTVADVSWYPIFFLKHQFEAQQLALTPANLATAAANMAAAAPKEKPRTRVKAKGRKVA